MAATALSHEPSCCADCDIFSSPTPAHGGVLVCYKFTGIVDGQHLARKEIAKNIYIYNVHYFFVICCMYVVYTASIVEGVI